MGTYPTLDYVVWNNMRVLRLNLMLHHGINGELEINRLCFEPYIFAGHFPTLNCVVWYEKTTNILLLDWMGYRMGYANNYCIL